MKIGKRIGFGVLLVAALLAAAVLVPSMGASPDVSKTKSEKALEYIAQKYAIQKEQLLIVNENEAIFPLSNQKIWDTKIVDRKSAEVYSVSLDELGNIVDQKVIQIQESAEYVKKYGKLEIDLYEKLQKMQPDERIKVAIWLTPINMNTHSKLDNSKIDEKTYGDFLVVYKRTIAEKEKTVKDTIEARGFKTIYTSQYAPLIFAELSKNMIVELEKRIDINAIYISRTYQPELNSAAYTEKADAVWNAEVTGSGIKIALVEDDGIEFANPYLADGIYYNAVNKNIGSHATAVAGVVASTNSTYKGIAYGAPALLSANSQNYSDSSIIAATEWALNNGANILSNSWGVDTGLQMGSMDRYLDHLVWTHYKTVVKSAGNAGTTNGNVTSPGLGYNMITVGAFDDMDDSPWSNDVNASYSSYRNPISPHNDREKPEVVAVGSRVWSTNTSSPWISFAGNGTSFAAPAVSGEAALLMQNRSWLTSWPETVKAVIMASAVHNIEGNSRLSEYDGAGGIDISNAYNIVVNQRMLGNVLSASSFPKDYRFPVTAGQKVRVVITWDSHPDNNHPPNNDSLQTDLDLYVTDPYGLPAGISASYDNNYEIVEFNAITTGTYNARASKIRFDGTTEYVGFAYTYV